MTQHFPPNSLIIPMSSAYQDPCGVVSAYGLIYKTLQANAWLESQNQPRILIHWVYSGTKNSPNRCVPTNLHPNPQTPSTCKAPYNDPVACNPLPYKDTNWNDGCDFNVASTQVAPVTLIDNTTGNAAVPASGCGSTAGQFCTRDTTATTADRNLTYPNFTKVVVQHSTTAASNVSVVQYLGGSFVIDASDAGRFLNLLNGTTAASDQYGNKIDFAPFRTAGTCSYGYDSGYHATVFTGSSGIANVHYVRIHRAQAGFDAPDTQRMNDVPGKIALLQTAGGDNSSSGVVGDMLPRYLGSAGLNFTAAQGCPPTGYNAKYYPANCPAKDKTGKVASGFIFDAFDVMDLKDMTLLNQQFTDSRNRTRYVYGNFWTPHWDGSAFSYWTGTAWATCDQACIDNARGNIASFVTRPAVGGTSGLLAECGSIGVMEGGRDINGYFTYPASGAADLADHRLMSCVAGSSGTTCAATDSGAAAHWGIKHEMDAASPTISNQALRNCTDPNLPAGQNCFYYPQPGDGYSQVGDYLWFPRNGIVSNFLPDTNNLYKAGVQPLGFTIGAVKNNGPSMSYSTARSQVVSDGFALYLAPTDGTLANAAPVVYLGGHSFSQDVAGTRVVLNTMLALGVVPDIGETAVAGPTLYNGNAFVSTYNRISTQNPPTQWQTYNFNTGSQWEFPYHQGDLRPHPISGTGALAANTLSAFNASVASLDNTTPSDAATALPGALARNVFTYVGGRIVQDPSLGSGKSAPNRALQVGWLPVDIDFSSVDPASAKCIDSSRITEINSTVKASFTGVPYAALTPVAGIPGGGTGGDGVCDLHQMLELENVPLGTDHGTSEGLKSGTIPAAQLANVESAKAFIQMIRGFCFATDGKGNAVQHPATIQGCDAYAQGFTSIQNDSPKLGGFVHSQVAIVPPSAFVADLPTGKHRPTVAYIGGLDGMLHAFYVPSDTLDNGYTGAASQVNFNPDASSTFHTALTPFALTKPLTELWAFIPPGQLPFLKTNSAMVDSSPVVLDVFGDFDGSGKRAWHTVLVASAGGSNRELFALDISNPLKPVLLWDIQSNFNDVQLQYAPGWMADDDTGLNATPLANAFSWQNNCHDNDASCTPSDFQLPPLGSPKTTGLYNYNDLGAAQSVSAAQMRRNNSPVFAAFVATNEPQDKADVVNLSGGNKVQGMGMYVFALDVVTGQKLWQFNNPYSMPSDTAHAGQVAALANTPPAGVSLLSKAGTSVIDTVYVGDEPGALWELDAADGLNTNSFAGQLGTGSGCTGSACCSGAGCNLALVQTYGSDPTNTSCSGTSMPEPISTLGTIFVLPPGETGPLSQYSGQALLAFGTAGTDAVAGLEPPSLQDPCGSSQLDGQVHLVPLGLGNRYQPQDLMAKPSLWSTVQANGVARSEAAAFPLTLTNGDRIYGSVVAAGDQMFFSTTRGSVNQLDARGTGGLDGSTFRLNLGAPLSSRSYDYYGALGLSKVGGVGGTPLLDAKTGKLVQTTDLGIVALNPPAGSSSIPPPGPAVNGNGQTPSGFLSWFFRRRGHER